MNQKNHTNHILLENQHDTVDQTENHTFSKKTLLFIDPSLSYKDYQHHFTPDHVSYTISISTDMNVSHGSRKQCRLVYLDSPPFIHDDHQNDPQKPSSYLMISFRNDIPLQNWKSFEIEFEKYLMMIAKCGPNDLFSTPISHPTSTLPLPFLLQTISESGDEVMIEPVLLFDFDGIDILMFLDHPVSYLVHNHTGIDTNTDINVHTNTFERRIDKLLTDCTHRITKLHQAHMIHMDIKPSNISVLFSSQETRLIDVDHLVVLRNTTSIVEWFLKWIRRVCSVYTTFFEKTKDSKPHQGPTHTDFLPHHYSDVFRFWKKYRYCGTLYYIAPELLYPRLLADTILMSSPMSVKPIKLTQLLCASDIWSFGITILQLVFYDDFKTWVHNIEEKGFSILHFKSLEQHILSPSFALSYQHKYSTPFLEKWVSILSHCLISNPLYRSLPLTPPIYSSSSSSLSSSSLSSAVEPSSLPSSSSVLSASS